MRVSATAIGFLFGLTGGVAIPLAQSEVMMVDGEPQRVVAFAKRGRVIEAPVVNRCLWVGLAAAVTGAGVGHFLSQGAHPGAAFLGAVLMASLSAGWRENLPKRYGQAGENTRTSDAFSHALIGALFAAAASVHWNKEGRLPKRLKAEEPSEDGSSNAADWPSEDRSRSERGQ
jgi:hypothetical protein